MANEYKQPQNLTTEAGECRRVGFELEFSGIGLERASQAVQQALGGQLVETSAAEHKVEVDGLGAFTVEIDWAFLKDKAREANDGDSDLWLEPLSQAATLLVPVEIVAPPIAIDRLTELEPMVAALRDAGAVGTEESFIAAYGVHINAEIPRLDAHTLHSYLCAFALLQWWLIDAHDVDTMRKLTHYIDPWPEAYLLAVTALSNPDLEVLIDTYLEHNPTRNRSLDMLPLLSEIDAEKVQSVVNDGRVNARPAFHYRLPNCDIEKADWSLARSWNKWCAVEVLAADTEQLSVLRHALHDANRPILGVSRRDWVSHMDAWARDRGLA